MKLSHPQANLYAVKNTKISDPIGRRLKLTMKSQRSITAEPSPRGWNELQTLNPRAQGMERTATIMALLIAAFLRGHFHSSMVKAMRFSNTATTVVIAAKLMNRKKSVPHRRPPTMLLKIFGRTTKISPGPWAGS